MISARTVLHVRVSRGKNSIVCKVLTREDAPSLMLLPSRRREEKRGGGEGAHVCLLHGSQPRVRTATPPRRCPHRNVSGVTFLHLLQKRVRTPTSPSWQNRLLFQLGKSGVHAVQIGPHAGFLSSGRASA